MNKIKSVIFFVFVFMFTLISCKQTQLKTPPNAINMFEKFISKEKFQEDNSIFYPGISDEKLKPVLTELINKSAEDFKELAINNESTKEEYQNAIETGLKRFSNFYLELDTEDRERICTYYEELMDIVGLESSGGHLNNFIYGFDPAK